MSYWVDAAFGTEEWHVV